MEIAIIKLQHNLPVNINVETFHIEGLLHNFWKPPKRVIEFWQYGCKIEYRGKKDYMKQKKLINKSLQETINETNN